MPVMSDIEGTFCRSTPWQTFSRRTVLLWTHDGRRLTGDVLEIGGVAGAMAEGVARAFPDVRLTVTDIDDVMVTAAKRRLSSHANINVEQADVTALPFPDPSFDAVTCYLMLHHVIAWQEALALAARVLRPGGAFIATTSPTPDSHASYTAWTGHPTSSSRPPISAEGSLVRTSTPSPFASRWPVT